MPHLIRHVILRYEKEGVSQTTHAKSSFECYFEHLLYLHEEMYILCATIIYKGVRSLAWLQKCNV